LSAIGAGGDGFVAGACALSGAVVDDLGGVSVMAWSRPVLLGFGDFDVCFCVYLVEWAGITTFLVFLKSCFSMTFLLKRLTRDRKFLLFGVKVQHFPEVW
jgi:hypothetical protein